MLFDSENICVSFRSFKNAIKKIYIIVFWGFSIIGGNWPRRHFHAVCFSGFSAMLDLYMGDCQACLKTTVLSIIKTVNPFLTSAAGALNANFTSFQ